MISYLQLKRTLENSPIRIPLNAPDELKNKVQRLRDCGLIWEHTPFPREDHNYTTFHLSDRTPKPASDVIEPRFVGSMMHGVTPCVYDNETEKEYWSLWTNQQFDEVETFENLEGAQAMADLLNKNWDAEKWRVGKRPTIERVQVSFWQTGARAGLFSQQAYPIVDRPKDGYVTVELMANRRYTVDVARTKAVA